MDNKVKTAMFKWFKSSQNRGWFYTDCWMFFLWKISDISTYSKTFIWIDMKFCIKYIHAFLNINFSISTIFSFLLLINSNELDHVKSSMLISYCCKIDFKSYWKKIFCYRCIYLTHRIKELGKTYATDRKVKEDTSIAELGMYFFS